MRIAKAPLFNNSSYRVASIGHLKMAEVLKARYEGFVRTVVPQIKDHIAKTSDGSAKIDHILLLGSSSVYPSYNDIDLEIGLNSERPAEQLHLMGISEGKKQYTEKDVDIHYHGSDISSRKYVGYVFSKPILYGSIPSLYQSEIPDLLRNAVKDLIDHRFNKIIGEGDYRKASHALCLACRHMYSLSEITGTKLPKYFPDVVQDIYRMKETDDYGLKNLDFIRLTIMNWIR